MAYLKNDFNFMQIKFTKKLKQQSMNKLFGQLNLGIHSSTFYEHIIVLQKKKSRRADAKADCLFTFIYVLKILIPTLPAVPRAMGCCQNKL